MIAFFEKKNHLVRFTANPVKRKNFNRENHYRNRRERDHNDGREIYHTSRAFQIIVSRKKISIFFLLKITLKILKYIIIFFVNNF